MSEHHHYPHHSALCQSLVWDGQTYQIDIYDDGKGAWLLEIVDERGTSIVWNDSFASEQEALDEAIKAIHEGDLGETGSESLDEQPLPALDHPLTAAEFEELDHFLGGETLQDTSMDVATLEGFLTAIAIGPNLVMPSQWLPWVWDMDNGERSAHFESQAEASRIMSLIMSHYNTVVQAFNVAPESFEPCFLKGAQWGAAAWSEGFMLGFLFGEEQWNGLMAKQPIWFTPFLRLGTDEGMKMTRRAKDAEKWLNEITPSLVKINAHWKKQRDARLSGMPTGPDSPDEGIVPIVRQGPKIGRNDSCPCGSGKKFKKCCGAEGAPPTLN